MKTPLLLFISLSLSLFFGVSCSEETLPEETPIVQKQKCREQLDRINDGVIDETKNFGYSNDGFLNREETDRDFDGEPDEIIEYFRDSKGNLLRADIDSDGDGVRDWVSTYTNKYDDDDNLLWTKRVDSRDLTILTFGERKLVREETDLEKDGAIDLVFVYTYEQGLKVQKVQELGGSKGWAYAYDNFGNVIWEGYDIDRSDGKIDVVTTYANTYDEHGDLIRIEVDEGEDGVVELTYLYDYCSD